MSTSLIYHAFGAKTYDYVKTEYKEGALWLHITKKPDKRLTGVKKRGGSVISAASPDGGGDQRGEARW